MSESYITKNHFADGGNILVIGGTLRLLPGAEIEDEGHVLGAAAQDTSKLPYQADSEATTIAALREDFNTLLASLRSAGLMAEAPAE